jgi:hypothetical protein
MTGVKQIDMNYLLGRRCVFVQRVLPPTTGNAAKPFYLVFPDVGERGIGTGGGVKGPGAKMSGALQMLNETGVYRSGKIGDSGETAADQLLANFADEGAHLRMTTMVVRTFHIDETRFAQGGGLVELAFGGERPAASS